MYVFLFLHLIVPSDVKVHLHILHLLTIVSLRMVSFDRTALQNTDISWALRNVTNFLWNSTQTLLTSIHQTPMSTEVPMITK